MADCKKGEGPLAAGRKGEGEEAPPLPSSGVVESEEGEKAPSSVVGPKSLAGVRIKQEPSDDIKDYAETTMNELLGWYGYTDKVDQEDTAQLTLSSFRRGGDDDNRNNNNDNDNDDDGDEEEQPRRPRTADDKLKVNGDDKEDDSEEATERSSSERRGFEAACSESGESELDTGRLSVESGDSRLAEQHRSLVTALNKSREGKGAAAGDREGAGGGGGGGGGGSGGGGGEHPEGGAQYIVCAWCQKTGMKLFTLRTPGGSKAFCSEVCFTQCRRASFKKNKVCDWCKHVRHTVNFVDFQDGENQLQFCSEKCLNQYKMNIFCTETQEHLKQIQSQLNEERKNAALSPGSGGTPSSSCISSSKGAVSDAVSASASSSKKVDEQILITPELWLAKQHTTDKVPKMEVVDVDEEVKEEAVDKDPRKRDSSGASGLPLLPHHHEGKERRAESSHSSERSRSRELLLDRKRLSSQQPSSAVASYSSGLLGSKGREARQVPAGSDRALERSSRDRERVRRLFRDSGSDRDSRPLPHPSDSPASTSQFSSPPTGPQAGAGEAGGTPPMVPPMLLPHLNGLGAAGLAGLGLFNPLLCSSLFGPITAGVLVCWCWRWRRRATRSAESPVGAPRGSRAEGGRRRRERERKSGPPQGLHPSPFMLGLPPFACPPGFFPPDPAAVMGGLLALQGAAPTQAPAPPPPPLRPHQQHQQQQRDRASQSAQHRARGEGGGEEVPPLSATAGCLNAAGVPPVTVMMPFPVLLPVPVPIPIPLPIAPEKIQQFFKERGEHRASSQPPPPPPPSHSHTHHHHHSSSASAAIKTTTPTPTTNTNTTTPSSSSERSATRSHSPRDRDRDSVGSQHSGHSQYLNLNHGQGHGHGLGLGLLPQQQQQRSDSVSSDSSCHSPGPRTTPTRCHEVPTPGCLTCVTCRMFPRPGRQSIDSIMALRKTRESSADSIMTLRRESARSLMVGGAVGGDPPSSSSSSLPPKRSLTPVFPVTLDLSKRARLDENRNNEDEAIDLSKDSRSSTPARSVSDFSLKPSSHPPPLINGVLGSGGGDGGSGSGGGSSSSSSSSNGSVASGKENLGVEHDMASIDGDTEAGLKVPKIHIIDSRDDPPLAQPLPLPPADHAYSMRRSLILDAPSVPKPPRSPSPERRYVRTVPRDMVEAAKRRCLRARVRTK
ncbi:uncharacterized protein LOC143297649 [Babylonia areolata]|uniref:uncharacterized protein LOC143297649 n=1 Tax=Babylonia areolata TaxID=304850 RepID=UPI003FD49721